MAKDVAQTLARVFAEVLERQVFLFADPADPEDFQRADGEFRAVSMSFRGDLEGRLTLVLPQALLPEIAANFLGMDAEDPVVAARSPDACKELLNVTCGHLLTALCGEEPVFDLSIPALEDIAPATVAAWARESEALRFAVEGRPVLLKVSLAAPGSSRVSPASPVPGEG